MYVELAEALRRRGQREQALRVVMHGLGRHPYHADGHDCLGRIHADAGEVDQARDAWATALRIAPDHRGALKGMGFVLFRLGDVDRARVALEKALALDPTDEATRRALQTVRGARPKETVQAASAPPAPVTAAAADAYARPPIFRGLEGATADILLLDARGLVVAGGLLAADGTDVSEVAAAALAGVSGEAERTAEYLALGVWRTIVAESEHANLVLAPAGDGALLLVRRDRSIPVGLTLRVAERARGVATAWLTGQGA